MRRIHFERIFVHSFAFQYASSAVLKISACFCRLKVEKFHLMKSADYYDISVSIFGSACIGCGFFFVDFMKMSPFMLFIFRMVCTTLVFAMILFFRFLQDVRLVRVNCIATAKLHKGMCFVHL